MNASLKITMGLALLVAALATPLGCGSDVEDGTGGSAAAGTGTGTGATGATSSSSSGSGGDTTSAGGAGGSGATSSGGAGQGGSSGGECDELSGAFDEAFQAALGCNACMGAEPCLAGPKIFDACGCEVGANGLKPREVAAAQMAYDAWVAAGCGPHECGQDCPIPGEMWTCTPTGGGCDGACSFF